MKSDNNWQSISDLMSALMMIFLFISVAYMLQVQHEKARITEVAETYSKFQRELHQDLQVEFEDDLKEWQASLEKDNTIRFYAPEVLFEAGSSDIKPVFQEILNNFFPRYIDILFGEKYRDDIDEIRIEGHTSSEWETAKSFEDRYLANLGLSQHRSFEVLKYCISNMESIERKDWLKGILRANGLSFAKTVLDKEGEEDKKKSRRVEFKVMAKTRERIDKILEFSNE